MFSLAPLIFFVAALYASVGHGGASGYLALMALCSVAPQAASANALALNLLVAGCSLWIFRSACHFSWRLTWPFLVASMPAAFLGSLLAVPKAAYAFLLAAVLLAAAVRLAWKERPEREQPSMRAPCAWLAVMVGAGIGTLSGIVGVGGGIFLGPVLLFLRWANPKQAAATCACFILVNSAAGLAARALRGFGAEVFTPSFLLWVGAAFVGGVLGARFGAQRFSSIGLRRLLALVLVIASVKLFLPN